MEEKKERLTMKKLKEEIKRVEKIVAINNRSLRELKPILKSIAKTIGYNSMDIKKIIEGLKTHLGVDFEDPEIKECDLDLQFYIRSMFI